MFGYVFPQKPELKIREFAEYRAVYCGLCEALRSFGFGAKLFLNYDFVFAAMLFMSLNDERPAFKEIRCNTYPWRRVGSIEKNDALDYCAAALIITVRYKLLDDRVDEASFKKAAANVLTFLTKRAYNKAKIKLPDYDAYIESQTEKQTLVENERSESVDRASDSTANGLSFLLENGVRDNGAKAAIKRFGYLLGRFVYLADTLDDLKKDIKKNRYNPFIERYKLTKKSGSDEILFAEKEIKSQLRLSQSEAESSYRHLPLTIYKSILDNIVYLGLMDTAEKLGKKRKKEKDR